jgi:hypothetical protein
MPARQPELPASRLEVKGFQPFIGQHCETVATGSLLQSAGIQLSEAMLFGLGEGLGFIMINLSSLPLPFVGGRCRPFALTETLCRNLKLELKASETSSKARAWAGLESAIARGVPVGLQLDCFHLEYFSRPVHFAGHFVAAHAIDERQVWVVDTAPQGSLQCTSRTSLEKARFARGPMAAKARAWTLETPPRLPDLRRVVRAAIRSNARTYLTPAFKGASFLGIRKLADSLPHWQAQAKNAQRDLALAAELMERAGTGGALFRNFYRDFLKEAAGLLGKSELQPACDLFDAAAGEWSAVATLIDESARSGAGAPLVEAALRCRQVADIETQAMRSLSAI